MEAEKHILWRLNSGNCYFWWDNWTGMGFLNNIRLEGVGSNNVKVASYWNSGNWDILKLATITPSHLVEIILKVSFKFHNGINDQPI